MIKSECARMLAKAFAHDGTMSMKFRNIEGIEFELIVGKDLHNHTTIAERIIEWNGYSGINIYRYMDGDIIPHNLDNSFELIDPPTLKKKLGKFLRLIK